MAEVNIGKSEVIFNNSFIVKDNTSANINIPLLGGLLKIEVVFMPKLEGEERTAEWTFDEEKLKFVFKGWNSSTGTIIEDPLKFGEAKGKELYFQAAAYHIGNSNLVHLFILKER